MKKLLFTISAVAIAACAFAAPFHRPGPRPIHRPPPRVYHHHHHHNPAPYFWSGVVGGVLGSTLIQAVRPAPVIVTAPTPQPAVIIQSPTIPKQVWIEGRYEDRVQPNGVIIKVWVPGHWVTVP